MIKTRLPIVKPPKNNGNRTDLGAKMPSSNATTLRHKHQNDHCVSRRGKSTTNTGIETAKCNAAHPQKDIQIRQRDKFTSRRTFASPIHDIPTSKNGITAATRNATSCTAIGIR